MHEVSGEIPGSALHPGQSLGVPILGDFPVREGATEFRLGNLTGVLETAAQGPPTAREDCSDPVGVGIVADIEIDPAAVGDEDGFSAHPNVAQGDGRNHQGRAEKNHRRGQPFSRWEFAAWEREEEPGDDGGSQDEKIGSGDGTQPPDGSRQDKQGQRTFPCRPPQRENQRDLQQTLQARGQELAFEVNGGPVERGEETRAQARPVAGQVAPQAGNQVAGQGAQGGPCDPGPDDARAD